MKTWIIVLIGTVTVALPAMMLGPALWPPPREAPSPPPVRYRSSSSWPR
jgi:hypothetical protein